VIDAAWRLAYRTAYRGMRVYWRLARPNTHGALVAIWHAGRLLLVKNSYLSYWSLPGGYVRSGEDPVDAARRELLEEVGIAVDRAALSPALDVHHQWEGKRDHVEIFALEVAEAPRVEIDRREVVDYRLCTPPEALRLELFPPIRTHILRRGLPSAHP
jgi:8-oxo-dGTP pyrophosphatase MutT (NUDIX family)